jgi:hypothetical protein
VNREEEQKPGRAPSPSDGLPREENALCIEYLQRAVAQLLMKNEKMRFELFAVRQKIASIERAVFGAGSNDLRVGLPSFLLGALTDLCGGGTAGDHHAATMPAAIESRKTVPRNNRPTRWIHQANDSVDRGRG